jgi:Kef-type K+ transport system membrane component KefB
VLAIMAELGVILLLFGVGLESNLGEMKAVGVDSLLVACLGVVAPFFLGWYVGHVFLPQESRLVHVFLGATLCATSVGLTARVMKDLGRIQTPEARIILGAAVIDDVLGLVILAAVVGIIEAAAGGRSLAVTDIVLIAGKAALFLLGALFIGVRLAPFYFRMAARLKAEGVLLTAALLFCFGMAWLAARFGLAPIVGAFAAGLLLEDAHFERFRERGEPVHLEALIAPIGGLLIPLFFVRMGMQVDLKSFAHPELLGFAAVLTLAAILGKQICALGVLSRGTNRLAVGVGMIPRGEVGLIFAATGAALLDVNGHRVVNHETFTAVVLMVMITTMATPPALKWALTRGGGVGGRADGATAAPPPPATRGA